jgi:RNA polymerase sigma factor (sigma-70 family)
MVACGEKELAADITQDALATAYVHWKKVNAYDLPIAWVRKVAINKLHDEMRKRNRRKHSNDVVELSTIEAVESSVPTPMAVDLMHALELLPSQQRIAATLAYVDDCSISDISSAMGISTGSVKTHLFHARQSLQTTMALSE